MRLQRKHVIGIGAALLVAVAGGGAAIAASGHHGSGHPTPPSGVAGGPPPGGPWPGGDGPGRGEGFGRAFGPGADLQAASSYLGIPVDTLESDLRSGKTLAQIADATSGKSSGGLVDALVAAAKTRLQQGVSSGRLTQAQADRIESGLKAHVQADVNGTFPPPDGEPHGPGPGGDRDGDDGGSPAPTTTVPPTHI
jgi:hypothetical protein